MILSKHCIKMKVVFHHNHETLFQLKPLKPGFVVDRTPQSQNLIWSGHCRVNYKKKKLCGKQYTWETFLYPSQRHSRVRLCVVSHHTTVHNQNGTCYRPPVATISEKVILSTVSSTMRLLYTKETSDQDRISHEPHLYSTI